jgi:L-threonylcarbamoyladenylate synthase
MARSLAAEWSEAAEKLARRYWPGPLTLVVKKTKRIPDVVTAGLETVGLRAPAHPLALALIRAAGLPLAAPSANRFTALSPTEAKHVDPALADLILDGGPCEVGIESTVLSVASTPPVLYRPGILSLVELEAEVGPIELAEGVEGAHASPGLHPRHYSPRTPLLLGPPKESGRGAYLWITQALEAEESIAMPRDAAGYAHKLYATLHALDGRGLDWIAVERPPEGEEWRGIIDRLERASARDRAPW